MGNWEDRINKARQQQQAAQQQTEAAKRQAEHAAQLETQAAKDDVQNFVNGYIPVLRDFNQQTSFWGGLGQVEFVTDESSRPERATRLWNTYEGPGTSYDDKGVRLVGHRIQLREVTEPVVRRSFLKEPKTVGHKIVGYEEEVWDSSDVQIEITAHYISDRKEVDILLYSTGLKPYFENKTDHQKGIPTGDNYIGTFMDDYQGLPHTIQNTFWSKLHLIGGFGGPALKMPYSVFQTSKNEIRQYIETFLVKGAVAAYRVFFIEKLDESLAENRARIAREKAELNKNIGTIKK